MTGGRTKIFTTPNPLGMLHLHVLGSGSENTFIVGPELVRWCAGDCGGNDCEPWSALELLLAEDAPPLTADAAAAEEDTTAGECGDGLWGDDRLDTIELSLLLLLLIPLPCVECRVDMAGEEGRELLVIDCGAGLLFSAIARVGLW